MRVCQHCEREIKNKFALHVANCPLAPQHKTKYRAAMEDEEFPGVLGRRVDYDRRREPGMSSGGSLNHTFKLTWVEIGKLFDLHEKVKEDQEDNENYEDMDAEIELGNWACEREIIGLPVLNGGREVKHGEKTYVYYTIR